MHDEYGFNGFSTSDPWRSWAIDYICIFSYCTTFGIISPHSARRISLARLNLIIRNACKIFYLEMKSTSTD